MGRDGSSSHPVYTGEQDPMTAPYQPEDESPREACANLAMCFRALAREASRVEGVVAGRTGHWEVTQKGFSEWASRLERAVQRLDAEKAGWEAKTFSGTVGPENLTMLGGSAPSGAP